MRSTFIMIIALTVLCITSCEKIITPDLPETDKRLVVEGIISNEGKPHLIKLSSTTKYSYVYDSTSIVYETGAMVIISDDLGNSDTLTEIATGIFHTHTEKITGITGRSYFIDIYTNDGKHYQSKPEVMLPAPLIDSIYYDRNYSDKYRSNLNAYRYNVYIDWHDPKDEKNFYMFVISYYWNGVWQQQYQWNRIMNDNLKDGHFFQKNTMVSEYGEKYFSIKINLYALQKNNYDYWRIMYNQKWTNMDGYVNNTVPLTGNIFNVNDPNDYAIGYFQVSATSAAMVYVDK